MLYFMQSEIMLTFTSTKKKQNKDTQTTQHANQPLASVNVKISVLKKMLGNKKYINLMYIVGAGKWT